MKRNDRFVVVTGQKKMDRGSLVSDSPHRVAVEGTGRDRVRKGNTSDPQLSGKFLVNDAGEPWPFCGQPEM